jgi:hypothetical protein
MTYLVATIRRLLRLNKFTFKVFAFVSIVTLMCHRLSLNGHCTTNQSFLAENQCPLVSKLRKSLNIIQNYNM